MGYFQQPNKQAKLIPLEHLDSREKDKKVTIETAMAKDGTEYLRGFSRG